MVTVMPTEAWCINRASRMDRRATMIDRWRWDLPLQFFIAIESEDRYGGPLACMQSHLEIMRISKGPALILEDDAVFTSDFSPEISGVPDDWDVLWIGGYHIKPPVAHDVKWAIPVCMRTTHAYYIREPNRIAERLQLERPYGLFFPFQKIGFKQYSLNKWMVAQAASYSDIMCGYQPERFWN